MLVQKMVVKKQVKGWEAIEIAVNTHWEHHAILQIAQWLGIKVASHRNREDGDFFAIRLRMTKREMRFEQQAVAFIEHALSVLATQKDVFAQNLDTALSLKVGEYEYRLCDDGFMIGKRHGKADNMRYQEIGKRNRLAVLFAVLNRISS